VWCMCGVQQALAAHGCNSTLKHMINKIRRDSHVFERSVASLCLTFTFSLDSVLVVQVLVVVATAAAAVVVPVVAVVVAKCLVNLF